MKYQQLGGIRMNMTLIRKELAAGATVDQIAKRHSVPTGRIKYVLEDMNDELSVVDLDKRSDSLLVSIFIKPGHLPRVAYDETIEMAMERMDNETDANSTGYIYNQTGACLAIYENKTWS